MARSDDVKAREGSVELGEDVAQEVEKEQQPAVSAPRVRRRASRRKVVQEEDEGVEKNEEEGEQHTNPTPVSQTSTTRVSNYKLKSTIKKDTNFDKIKGKNVEESAEYLKRVNPWYLFGRTHQFVIPIENIIEPPAGMCCQKLNLDHVQVLMNEMTRNPKEPDVAEVVPFYKGKPKSISEAQKKSFGAAIPSLKFAAVAGQHSAIVVQKLIAEEEKTLGSVRKSQLQKILENLRSRKCRVLSASTHEEILTEISARNNWSNRVVGLFKSPFLDTIQHARSQYEHLGRPPRPDIHAAGQKTKQDKFWVFLLISSAMFPRFIFCARLADCFILGAAQTVSPFTR